MLRIFASLLCCLLALQLTAQSNLAAPYSQKDYVACLKVCEERLQANTQDSLALYFQGLCLIQQNDFRNALTSLRAAEQANYQPVTNCRVQQALCLTQLGDKTEALALLKDAVQQDYAIYQPLLQDQFAPLKEDNIFRALQDSVHQRAYPCYYDTNYTHFNFWLGEWDVFVGEVKVGDSKITKQEGGCAILEQYTTARDYSGQSLNFYDPSDGLWKQFWVDKTRGLTKYKEVERRAGYLQFISGPGSVPTSFGTLKMTFTLNEDKSVRQHMEQQQTPDGEWQTVFDGKYVKKK